MRRNLTRLLYFWVVLALLGSSLSCSSAPEKPECEVLLPEAEESACEACAFSPDGKTLAVVLGFAKGRVLLIDMASRQEHVLTTVEGWCNVIAFSPDGKLLGIGYGGGQIELWDPITRKDICDL